MSKDNQKQVNKQQINKQNEQQIQPRRKLSPEELANQLKSNFMKEQNVSSPSMEFKVDTENESNKKLDLGLGDDENLSRILGNSFIIKYLADPMYTDLSYNGTQFRVQHNEKGRFMPEEQPTKDEVFRLIKSIADYKEKEFTNNTPVLDTEIGHLRVNAMHEQISPDGLTMALRVSRPRLAITDLTDLARGNPERIEGLLSVLIKGEQNIIISGRTGTGKTEFQKKLVGYISNDSKITLIEDTRDSHLKAIYPDKDINSWQTTDGLFTMSDGVRAALRNNPDWVIIAETRGEVSADILDSAKTDHSIITTIHASSAMGIPSRLVPMIRQSASYARMEDLLIGSEIVEFLRFGIQLKAEREHGRMVRYIREIAEFTKFTPRGAEGNFLYRFTNQYDPSNNTYKKTQQYGQLSMKTMEILEERKLVHMIPDVFIPMEYKRSRNMIPNENNKSGDK